MKVKRERSVDYISGEPTDTTIERTATTIRRDTLKTRTLLYTGKWVGMEVSITVNDAG
jgi:hypothetical protein